MNPDRWTLADECFAVFVRDLQAHAGRVTRLHREAGRGLTRAHREAVEYTTQTEMYVKYLRHERQHHDGAEDMPA